MKLTRTIVFILFCISYSAKPQVFGYGAKCELANTLELAKIVLTCVDNKKISKTLNNHNNYGSMLGVYMALDSKGNIISLDYGLILMN